MKKIKLVIIALIIICLIMVSVIFVLKNNSNNSNNSNNKDIMYDEENFKDIKSKLEEVKRMATSDIYFPFEENNKQYILFGYRISNYSDLEKSSMEIQSINYKNEDLIIELEINEVRKKL